MASSLSSGHLGTHILHYFMAFKRVYLKYAEFTGTVDEFSKVTLLGILLFVHILLTDIRL